MRATDGKVRELFVLKFDEMRFVLQLAMPESRLVDLVSRQLSNLFEFDRVREADALAKAIDEALAAVARCFVVCRNKYYRRDGEAYFNPFHSGQNSIFLYYLSRHLALNGYESLADRVYCLNKALNGLDVYHAVAMPEVFFLDHPVGAVIGRATIANGFVFCQNCTVGNSRGIFPVFEQEVTMFAGSSIIGDCHIGRRSIIGAGVVLVDRNIPSHSVVSLSEGRIVIRSISAENFERRSFFDSSSL